MSRVERQTFRGMAHTKKHCMAAMPRYFYLGHKCTPIAVIIMMIIIAMLALHGHMVPDYTIL